MIFDQNDFEKSAEKSADFLDVSIIGAGVAGLYAAYCCGLLGLSCSIIDSLMCAGGQCGVLYPEKKVYGVPGFIDIKSKDFVSKLSEQCLDFPKELYFGHKVENISKDIEKNFIIKTSRGSEIKSKHLIIATGMGDMKPMVPPNIEGLSDTENSSDFVQYYCMKMDIYKNKDVIIAGGGDSAVDFATNIAPIAKSVTIIHRRNKFTCEEHKVPLIEKMGIKTELEQQILEVQKNFVRTDKNTFHVDYIIFCYGFAPNVGDNMGLLDMGLEVENNLIKVDVNTMSTSIENCYAIGDVVSYPNKKKNIVPCFFEADRSVRTIKSKMMI